MCATVSIIIPCYNTQDYLEECLDSILCQTFTDFEIILVDDGSKDRTAEICDSYAFNYPFIHAYHIENHGVSNARNLGLTKCSGEIVMFVDSDDIISPDFIQILYKQFMKTQSDISYCATYKFSGKIPSDCMNMNRKFQVHTIFPVSHFDYCSDIMHSTVWGCLFSKRILDGLQFDEKLFIAEDSMYFNSALQKAKKICFVDLPLYFYRQRTDSETGRSPYDKKKVTEITAWKKIVAQNDAKYPNSILAVSSHCILGMVAIKGIKFMYRDGGFNLAWLKAFVSIAKAERPYAMKAYKTLSKKIEYLLFCIFPRLCGMMYKYIKWITADRHKK